MFSINLHGLELQDRRLEDGHLERLGKLCELWANYAPAVNLTAKIDESSLRAQLRESLLLVSLARDIGVQPGERWVDVGAGGGFPGLVVAATLGVALTLVEPRQRRAAFLGSRSPRLAGAIAMWFGLDLRGRAGSPSSVATFRHGRG